MNAFNTAKFAFYASNIAKFAFYASKIAKFAFYQFNSPAIDSFMLSQCPGQLPLTVVSRCLPKRYFFPTLSLHVEAALLINSSITIGFLMTEGTARGIRVPQIQYILVA